MKFTSEEIQKLAQLARLDVSDEELQKYANQLTDILNYAEQVQNFSGLEELTEEQKAIQIIDSVQMREDSVLAAEQSVLDLLLQEVPQKHGNFVKSPKAL